MKTDRIMDTKKEYCKPSIDEIVVKLDNLMTSSFSSELDTDTIDEVEEIL